MVMTSDETQIQILANWPMSHAKRVTRDNRKNLEYRVVAAIRKTADRHKLSRRKSMAKPCKNEQHIGSEKTYGPKNTEQWNIMMQRLIRSFTDPTYTGSIFVCGPLHHFVPGEGAVIAF